MPERRRRRLRPFTFAGALIAAAGFLLDFGFARGLGVGMLLTAGIAWLLDAGARRRLKA